QQVATRVNDGSHSLRDRTSRMSDSKIAKMPANPGLRGRHTSCTDGAAPAAKRSPFRGGFMNRAFVLFPVVGAFSMVTWLGCGGSTTGEFASINTDGGGGD